MLRLRTRDDANGVKSLELSDGPRRSIKIAEQVESVWPEPSLKLDTKLHEPVADAVMNVAKAIWADALLLCVRHCLTEKSAVWFSEDRDKHFGMSLEEFAANYGGEDAWKAAEALSGPLENLKDVLTKQREDVGPFALGTRVSYGDFVAVSLFECFERMDEKTYERPVGFETCFKDLHEACQPWLQRAD